MGRLVFACTVLMGLGALAYVLPSVAVIRRMGDVREDVQLPTLRVDGTVVFTGPALQEGFSAFGMAPQGNELQVDATVWLKSPDKCRLELRAPKGRAAVFESEGKQRLEGQVPASLQVALGEICAFLAQRPTAAEVRRALYHHLQALGVNLRSSSLARAERQQLAYVLGDLQEGKSQLVVLKGSFEPARIHFRRPDGLLWDVRFLEYGSAAAGEGFPRVIEVLAGGELGLRFTALHADGRTNISDKLF